MQDLERAKQLLTEKDLSLVIIKDERPLFQSDSSGINGLLEAIDQLAEQIRGASVADRIVGRAAALLFVSSCVRAVYAATLSEKGLNVFANTNIQIEHAILVPMILNRTGDDFCPFEKFSSSIKSPAKAYEKLKTFAESLKNIN